MITEVRFSQSHSGFWAHLLPMSEYYIRTINLGLARFARPLEMSGLPANRGLVNELSMRMFARSHIQGIDVQNLDLLDVQESLRLASEHIENLRRWSRRGPLGTLSPSDIEEAKQIGTRLSAFFQTERVATIHVFPEFQGCGWLSSCSGDVYADGLLYEVKAGERAFRSIDLRQLLTYCALNFASKKFEVTGICLINPREGTYVQAGLDELCSALAGRSAVDVLSEIVEYVSNPDGINFP